MDDIISRALEMQSRARVPYSGYRVGAAVLTADETIIGGCNVESSSYSLTCCAERVALFRAIAEGHQTFKAIAIATDNGGTPCGACRQVIWEICGDIPLYVVDNEKNIREFQSRDLLPNPFDDRQLI